MKTEDFRKHAHTMVDWMADYLDSVDEYPVRSQVAPGDIAGQLPHSAPEQGEAMEQIFADFKDVVVPGLTHWQHPRFFAYFPANSSAPSVLAEMLMATVAVNCLMWETSPAGTEMEEVVIDWLRQLTGVPEGWRGVIQDSASSATFCAILTGREKATGWRANEEGLPSCPTLTVYTSDQTHSSIEKAVTMAGIGRNNLRVVPSDDDFAMRTDELDRLIEADKAAGLVPACVVASVGATGVGGVDPLRAVGEICRRHGIYLHVDAAWAGSAMILPEHRHLIDGLELADSFIFNPHKWLFTNFDCTAHFVRDPEPLTRTLSILPEYLKTRVGSAVTDFRDWGVPLGRRFRALKLWFVMRSYGAEGMRAIIRDHIAWTGELAEWIAAEPDFELTSKPVLGLLSFRYVPAGVTDDAALDALNDRLTLAINDDGRLYLTKTKSKGRTVIRWSIGQTRTTLDHVRDSWAIVEEIARSLEV